jgi:hypothetical protein
VNDRKLDDLLEQADRSVSLPRLMNVAGAARRRRQARFRGRVAALLLLAAGGIAILRGGWPVPGGRPVSIARSVPDSTRSVPDSTRLLAEIEELRLSADLHQRIADEMLRMPADHRRRAAAGRVLAVISVMQVLEEQREKSAALLVEQGDRLGRSDPRVATALSRYRFAAELYPATHWGKIARRRIEDAGG